MSEIEKYYGKVFRSMLWLINPLKKMVIETECQVHRFINYKALKILDKYKYVDEFHIFNKYLEEINRGAVWADQDFKSINHFYNPGKKKGLYGHSNALKLASNYSIYSKKLWVREDYNKSMFYLVACVHIIQAMTIPHHVNIKLLNNHRQYENFVKVTYDIVKEYTSLEEPIILNEVEHYIRFNTKKALKIHRESKDIKNNRERFHHVTRCILPLAQRTTAGCFIMFLEDVKQL